MLSYHNDESIKEKYLARIDAHYAADEIIKGQYWEGGKGCAVGCTIHSNQHDAYELELGLPEWLARLEDTLFEGLENDKAKEFPRQFLDAIPVGANLESVKWKFCAFILQENIERVLSLDLDDALKKQVVDAIGLCLDLHTEAIETGEFPESARSAGYAARSAAESAAGYAARYAAGYAAGYAAWSAAGYAAYERYAEKLLELLREAK